MSYIIYYLVTGAMYFLSLSIIFSISFLFLSKFFTNLKTLLLFIGLVNLIILTTIGISFQIIFLDSVEIVRLLYIIPYAIGFILLLKKTLFNELPGPIIKQIMPENTKYWSLDSGSRIAYWNYQATKSKKKYPIIYVHGGPGAHVRNMDRTFFKEFTKEGYDVYLYDQPGGGFSDYLDITEYSMTRFVNDLDSIRRIIKTEKVILVGQSFGARICSMYALEYEEHVEQIIYVGAAGLKKKSIKDNIKDKKQFEKSEIIFANTKDTEFKPTLKEGIRFVFSILMCKLGGHKIVSQFITQKEITEYGTRMIPDAIARAYHIKYKDKVPTITSGGINTIVNVLMHNDYDKISNKLISQLKGSKIKVLILRSSYDYVPWEDTKHYKEIFINHSLVHIEESGHIAWSINEKVTFDSILHFLKGEASKLELYTKDSNPILESREIHEKEIIPKRVNP